MATLHLMTDAELPSVLALLASSGGTARSQDSWTHDCMTALLLGESGHPTAAMPFARRTIHTSPARPLLAGWISSNQFAARMSLRRQTRATAADWPTLLPELDALVVLRRDESSLAARWYAHTGFEELLSIRCLYLDMDAPPAARPASPAMAARYQVQVVTPADASSFDAPRLQAEMFAVYQDVYGSYGGAPLRSPTFWAPTLAHHYYREHYQFQIIALRSGSGSNSGTLMGYAVVGWSGWHSKRPRMDILELATRQWDTGIAADLIQTTCQLAWSKNVKQVRAVISAHDPYRGHLTRTSFVDRWGYLMLAKWLHPQRYLDRLAAHLPPELSATAIQFTLPGQVPLTLRPANAQAILQLQTTPAALTRLLMNRLDIATAMREGTLSPTTGVPMTDASLANLSLAFPWTPWAFHMLDYI